MQVITQLDEHGHKLEPYEEAVVEVPEAHMGGVVDLMGSRKGQMQDMSASAEGLNRVTYRIPTRGLLGLRNAILTATKVWAPSLSLSCCVASFTCSRHFLLRARTVGVAAKSAKRQAIVCDATPCH